MNENVNSISKSWQIIDSWLSQNAPGIILNPPASEDEIAKLEQLLNKKLPDDFKESLLIHNGQSDGDSFVDASEFLSIARMQDEWSVWKGLLDGGDFDGITCEPIGPIKDDWWNQFWIPFTYDGSGNHYCVDLDPPSGGNLGQIIKMWHDDAERPLIAPSFKTWLSDVAVGLSGGQLVFSEDYGGIVPKEDL